MYKQIPVLKMKMWFFLDPKFLFWPCCTLQLVKPSSVFSSKWGGVQNWLKWSLLIRNFSSSEALKVRRVPLFTDSLSTECKAFKTTPSKGSLHLGEELFCLSHDKWSEKDWYWTSCDFSLSTVIPNYDATLHIRFT